MFTDCNGLDDLQGASRTGAIYTDSYYEAGNARALDEWTIEVETLFPAPAFIPTLALDVFEERRRSGQQGVDQPRGCDRSG